MKCLIGLPPTFMLPVKGFTKPAIACGKCCDPKIFRALNIGSIKNELLTTNLYRISGVAKGGGRPAPGATFMEAAQWAVLLAIHFQRLY